MIHYDHMYCRIVNNNVLRRRQTAMSLKMEEAFAKKLHSLGFKPVEMKNTIYNKKKERIDKAINMAEVQILTASAA
jgi:hypothetical protein